MFIRSTRECMEFVAGDNTRIRELFNPLRDDIDVRFSMAHACLQPGRSSTRHILKTAEVYYIIQGEAVVHIEMETRHVAKGDVIYVPPDNMQWVENIGQEDLEFLCLVDPAWRPEDEEFFEE